jgi:hypothetical protein
VINILVYYGPELITVVKSSLIEVLGAYVVKLFFCLSLTKRQKARVLFLGKLFQPSLILMVKASSLTLMGETCSFSTGVTSGLIFKYKTRIGRFVFFMTLIC